MNDTGFVNMALCTAPALQAPDRMETDARPSAWRNVAATRGGQAAWLLLSAVPLAERLLLYQVAMAAWFMLPQRGWLERIASVTFRR
jgi:hypothetical protein